MHYDGSSRVQPINKIREPILYKILLEFEKISGLPILLNTSFNLNGEPKFYGTKGSMGSTVNRGFCSNCGSGIFSYLKELPNFLFLKVGSLEDSSWVKIESNYFTKSCNKWNMPDEQLKSFKGNPNLLENIKTLIKSLN